MKRIASKVLLTILIISFAPLSADLRESLKKQASSSFIAMQNGTRMALQTIAQNPGWTSLVAGWAVCTAVTMIIYKNKVNALNRSLNKALEKLHESQKNVPISPNMIPEDTLTQEADLKKTSIFVMPTQEAIQEGVGLYQEPEEIVVTTPSNIEKQERSLKESISHEKYKLFKRTAQVCMGFTALAGLFAWSGTYISKACGWLGSRI